MSQKNTTMFQASIVFKSGKQIKQCTTSLIIKISILILSDLENQNDVHHFLSFYFLLFYQLPVLCLPKIISFLQKSEEL